MGPVKAMCLDALQKSGDSGEMYDKILDAADKLREGENSDVFKLKSMLTKQSSACADLRCNERTLSVMYPCFGQTSFVDHHTNLNEPLTRSRPWGGSSKNFRTFDAEIEFYESRFSALAGTMVDYNRSVM